MAYKSGYVTQAQLERIARIQASQRRRAAVDQARVFCERSGVWKRYEAATLDGLDYPKARLSSDHFKKYVETRDQLATLLEDPGILVLSGENGPGKTHLASALVFAFCERGFESRFITANDFFLSLKSTFGEKGRTFEDVIRRFRSYEFLAIDEIEVRSDSAWENYQLRDLINARYSSVKSTVIITNKTPEEINGSTNSTPYFSTAIRDRIRDDGGIVHCDWPSLRGTAA